jgi:hypothetical protein
MPRDVDRFAVEGTGPSRQGGQRKGVAVDVDRFAEVLAFAAKAAVSAAPRLN